MAVIPVGAALPNRELIDEGLTRADAGKAHAWHTVHREWHEKAVPMDRAVLVELVGDRQPDILPLLEAEQRRGHGAVDAARVRRLAISGQHHSMDGGRDETGRAWSREGVGQ